MYHRNTTAPCLGVGVQPLGCRGGAFWNWRRPATFLARQDFTAGAEGRSRDSQPLGCPQGLVTPGGGGTGNPCSAPADTPPPPPPSGPAPPHKISPPHSTPAERRRLGARQTAARQPEVRHRQGAAVSSTVASPPSPSDPPPAYPHTAAPPPLTPRIERSMFSRPTGSADSTVYLLFTAFIGFPIIASSPVSGRGGIACRRMNHIARAVPPY